MVLVSGMSVTLTLKGGWAMISVKFLMLPLTDSLGILFVNDIGGYSPESEFACRHSTQ